MRGHGTRLDFESRKYIEKGLKEGKSAYRVSEELGAAASTVENEIFKHRECLGDNPVCPRTCSDWSLPSGKSGKDPLRRPLVCDGCPKFSSCDKSKYVYRAETAQREEDAVYAEKKTYAHMKRDYMSDDELEVICRDIMSHMERGCTLLGAYKAAGVTRFTKQWLFQMVHDGKTAKFGLTEEYCRETTYRRRGGAKFKVLNDPKKCYASTKPDRKKTEKSTALCLPDAERRGYIYFTPKDRRFIERGLDDGLSESEIARERGLKRQSVERDVRCAVEGSEGLNPRSCPDWSPATDRPSGRLPCVCNGCRIKSVCEKATLYDAKEAKKRADEKRHWTWDPEKKGPRKKKKKKENL